MREAAFMESRSLRAYFCNRDEYLDIIDRVGQLIVIPGTAWAIIENIAAFYQVPKNTIEYVIKRHRDELLSDGYNTLQKKDLENWHYASLEIPNRGISVFPRRAVLRIGMLLRDK